MNQINKEVILDNETKNNLKEIQEFVSKIIEELHISDYIESNNYFCYPDELENFIRVCDCLLDDNIQIF